MFEECDKYIKALDKYTELLSSSAPQVKIGEHEETVIDTIVELFEEEGWRHKTECGVITFYEE